MPEILTTIQLTDLEAKTFMKFQKHRALIDLLEKIEAFEVKPGSVTIHFDTFGGITSVEKMQYYRA